MAREPLNSRKLSRYANLADGTEARTLIRRLNKFYEKSERAFRVEEIAGGFRLMTRPQFGAWVRRLAHVPLEVRLSAPALETLAVVAYRQPVLKATIEAIRGVNCGEMLRQLMERDLVRIFGRSDELGRPYLYAPTVRFLEVFGLRSLDELPRVEGLLLWPKAAATDNQHPREEHDVTVTYPSAHPQQENETVRIQDLPQVQLAGRGKGAIPVVAADEDEFEESEELEDDEDEELEDDEDLDEEFDEELDEEEWEYEDEEDGEFEDDLEEDEWEEVEEDDDEDLEDDEDWEDDDEEEDEDWEDD